jgi:hypothetical protein
MKETDLAKKVVEWLHDWHWTVYQEVQVFRSIRADIVAVIEPRIWVIEVKVHHGINVLEQAHRWLPWSHCVSIAVPYTRGYRRGGLLDKVHRMTGIGLIRVGSHPDEIIPPHINRKANAVRIKNGLHEEHKHFAEAGSNCGGYFTAFAGTKKRFVKLINERPGLTIKEIVDNLGRTHYASGSIARTALSQWVRKGYIPEVERKREGKFIKYYPAPAAHE